MLINIVAAFTFFTRLPFWRICHIPADRFKRIVCYWPLVGWLTGYMTAFILWLTYPLFPDFMSVLLAFTNRILLTRALHEDGLADFLDGMGGGNTRMRILEIMKDTSIGTYGVVGLFLYSALWIGTTTTLLSHFPVLTVCMVLITGDIWCKWCASQLINLLPYARKESEAKIKVVYDRMSPTEFLTGAMAALLPFLLIFMFKIYGWLPVDLSGRCAVLYLILILVLCGLVSYMKKRINGYTGDCCGATFLICELLYVLTIPILWKFI